MFIRFYLGHDLDLEFSRSNKEFPISQPKFIWLPRNEKQAYWLNSRPQMWPMGLTLTITFNLDLLILKVKRDIDFWPHAWPWPWIFMDKFWNSCISEWEGRLTLHKGGGSRSFITMTISWPRSGVWIVTGMTSVVGMPSTHLVWLFPVIINISVNNSFVQWSASNLLNGRFATYEPLHEKNVSIVFKTANPCSS